MEQQNDGLKICLPSLHGVEEKVSIIPGWVFFSFGGTA